jgi:hypothetical protein
MRKKNADGRIKSDWSTSNFNLKRGIICVPHDAEGLVNPKVRAKNRT